MTPDSIPLTWRSNDGRHTVTVSKACIKHMISLAKKNYPNEIGSSLVGRYSSDKFTATVTNLAPPPPDSKGSRKSFHRGVQGTLEFFSSLFQKTKGKRHYVGEWHSHPGGSPLASRTDDITHSAIAADNDTDCRECVLLILGGNFQDHSELQVYVYSRENGKIALEAIEE